MNVEKPGDQYLNPYRESARQHGTGFSVTLWSNERSQRARFEVFTQMCFLPGKRILDAGCSRGDFARYLIERDIAFSKYVGVDALPEVIAHARSLTLANCEFHVGDFVSDPAVLSLGDPQVICISGALNTMTDEQVFATLESAWRATRQTLIFNFLSDRADRAAPPQSSPARRLETLRLLDWALGRTSSVRFRQDYFRGGHDATILMRKK